MARPSQVFGQLRGLSVPLVLFSLVTNLSVLVSPLFMMHVLDRVVPSGNLHTLIMLLSLALLCLATTALVEYFRDQALGRVSGWVEQKMVASVFDAGGQSGHAEPLRDVGRMRDFIASQATTLFDIPWIPLFLAALFLLHPAFFGLVILLVSVFAVCGWLSNYLAETAENSESDLRRGGMSSLAKLENFGSAGLLMGVRENLQSQYLGALNRSDEFSARAQKVRNVFGSINRFLRGSMQVGSLALGAFLVTQDQLSAGGMIGASILLGKVAGIMESVVRLFGQRKPLMAAIKRLEEATGAVGSARTEVADLSGAIRLVDAIVPRGGGQPPRLDRSSVQVAPGECVAIMGESGSGKTTLLEALAGINPPPIGNCFLDQTDIRTLDTQTRNSVIGFVPQTGHIQPGTIAQNIACFAPQPDDARVLAAARIAGVHGMISALPDAYETDLGATPFLLSAGQRQRIAFARALYSQPKYLFMDEPNALLDHNGERLMADAIYRLKTAGTTIVMTAHRMGIVNLSDRIIVMGGGRIADVGPRAEILGRVANSHRRLRLPISGGAGQDLLDWVHRQFVRDGDEEFKARATTVATELYMFAKENGPNATDRLLSFEFNFVDDTTCSITLSEAADMELQAKIHKVKGVVEMSLPDVSGLQNDEKSLATVMQLSDVFEHRSEEEFSAFFARITHAIPERARVN
ncbi:MAG: ATP-binding cassette domain-containing protein [Pseudomonadota bacterium]